MPISRENMKRDSGEGLRGYRFFFLVLVFFLPLQFAFSELKGEPYPAVIMPGFSGPGAEVAQSDHYKFTAVRILIYTEDGQEKSFTPRELFQDIPEHHSAVVMWKNFPFATKKKPPLTGFKKFVAENLTPSINQRRRIESEQYVPSETKAWLYTQAQRLLENQTPKSAMVQWYTISSSKNGTEKDESGIIEEIAIAFDGGDE